MKRAWRILLLLAAVMALLVCNAFAAEAPVGNVTFTYAEVSETDGVKITGITIADTVADPIDVQIPASIGDKSVLELDLQGLTTETAAKIKTLTFAGDVPVIHGNLFKWQYENKGLDLESNGYGFASGCSIPNTNTLLENIPAFVTGNYNYDSNDDGTNDTYYAGVNLVRVDAGYTGDLTVKEGTVSILAGAMEGCANLGAVTLPGSVEWIGVRAFANSGVTSVNLPAGLLTNGSKEIQMQTFFGCEGLKSVTFPDGTDKLTKVGYLAFYNCSSLTGFDFTSVSSLDTLSFAKAFAAGTAIDLSQTSFASSAAPFSHSGVGSVTFGTATGGTIPFEAFYKCASLTELKGMKTVTQINAWAFSDCTSLAQDVLVDCTEKSLDLSSAYRAFANNAMTEITIPETVMNYMAGGIFAGNEQLETVNWYSSIKAQSLFAILNDCLKGTYHYCWSQYAMPGMPSGEYTLPKTLNVYAFPYTSYSSPFFDQPYLETVNVKCEITTIPKYAFSFCPNLKTITFDHPEKITSIGYHAFGGCLSLKSFPFTAMTGLTTIDENAFILKSDVLCTPATYEKLSDTQKTYGLTEIDLSQCTALNSIGLAAFYNQYSVTSLHLPAGCSPSARGIFHGTVSMKELICEGDLSNQLIAQAMITSTDQSSYNNNLETVTVKGQLIYSGTPIFFGMDALKTVNLPNATSIPQDCFHSCTGLETVNAPKVTTMGKNAFFGTQNLKSISLPELTAIPEDGFLGCNGLETVDLPKVTTMGKNSFYGLTNLKSVSLPEATSIPAQCFMNCTALETVNAPKIKDVGNHAFFGSGLKETVISNGITYGDYVFMNSKLEKVVVEESVTELGDFMFEGCTALKQVALPSTLETINWAAFKNAGACTIDIPASVTKIEDDAFCSGSFSLVFRGAPSVELVHPGSVSGLNTLLPINSDATIYYANDTAKTAAEVYAASLPEDITAPAMAALSNEQELVITGAPTSVMAGEALDLTNLKVTYNGTELTSDQYAVDYDATDKTVGSRTVTVTVIGDDLPVGLQESTISAKSFSSENVSGKVYAIGNTAGRTGTFTVEVTAKESTAPVTPTYPPTVTQPEAGGTVTVSPKYPIQGSKVTITATPDEGYEVDEITVTDKNGNPVEVTDNGDGTYSFTQPASRVTIKVVFRDATVVPFVDVPANAYYCDAVQWAVKNGITYGTSDTTFSPDASCTRAQMAAFLWRAAGCPEPKGTSSFTDVPSDAYYAKAVAWAVENGITGGVGNDKFAPDDVCTRAQMAAFLYRLAGGKAEGTGTFTDVSADAYYAEAVQWAVENGITDGVGDNRFAPDVVCTRGQMATFLYRFFVK